MVSVAPWKAQAGVVPRLRDADGYRIRAAAVCIQGCGAAARVLLVSGGKNHQEWAIPGGGVEKDENHEEAAARELEEEAGVRAEVLERIGVFQDDAKRSRTTVFLMKATKELEEWPEGQFGRKRLWVLLAESTTYLKNSHREYLTTAIKNTGIQM